jgi:hypothetical protein
MTPHAMRGVASRPERRSTPIRARRRGACLPTGFEMWWQLSLPANSRIGVAPSGRCVCHAYRRPVVRPHRGCGDSSDRRSGCPIGPGWRCRQSGRPIGSRLHCRHIVPQIRVALPFRSKGRNCEPYSYEGGSHKFGCHHDRSSLVRDREQRPFYTARHPKFLFNKGDRMGRRSATRKATNSNGARLPANLIRNRLQRIRRCRAHKTIANAVVRPGKPGGAAV